MASNIWPLSSTMSPTLAQHKRWHGLGRAGFQRTTHNLRFNHRCGFFENGPGAQILNNSNRRNIGKGRKLEGVF